MSDMHVVNGDGLLSQRRRGTEARREICWDMPNKTSALAWSALRLSASAPLRQELNYGCADLGGII